MPIGKSRKSPGGVSNTETIEPVQELLERIRSEDDEVRTEAWRGAGSAGAAAVEPLAGLTSGESMEVARAANRGLWQIVRNCGRPGADSERQAVQVALVGLLREGHPVPLRRDVLWMVSEIGDEDCVTPIAGLLADAELREDACLTLERIPGEASLAALTEALDAAEDDFKPHIAESLRRRGHDVRGLPSAKLTPSKPTDVTPL